MKLNLLLARIVLLVLFTGSFFLFRPALQENKPQNFLFHTLIKTDQGEGEEEEEGEEAYTAKRLAHEFKMLRNPITGKIPANIREIEFEAVRNIPSRGFNNTWLRGSSANAQNNYTSVGPNNIAGRSRGLAFDRRNANIVLTGGVTGGIFRSTDGGFIWNFVSGENDIRSATSISQDPTSPDVWYCGTGEVYYPNSGADIAGTVGHGMYKSTNNGASWAKLSPTEDASPHQFNGSFDLVHRVAVHPVTGHVYAAVHNRIMKSTDKGNTWQTVLGGVVSNTSITGITEVIISS